MQTKQATQYFYGCESIEEVKQRFKKLAKTLHPDTGGNTSQFIEMKGQYDNIIENGIPSMSYAEVLMRQYVNSTPTERTTHLSPEEINRERAVRHFAQLHLVDATYDIIDHILEQAAKEKFKTLWVFQEVSKLLELDLNHFKYVTFMTDMSTSVAHQLYKKYLGI